MVEGLYVLTSGEIGSILSKLKSVCDGIIRLSKMKIPTRQLLTDTELSWELKLSKKTLANYRAKGEFGYYALPGKILYDTAEIDSFLQQHYLPPFR